MEYNFITDLTSLVIEQNDDYIKKRPVQINLNLKFEEDPEFGVGARFGINNIQSGLLASVLGNIFFLLFCFYKKVFLSYIHEKNMPTLLDNQFYPVR